MFGKKKTFPIDIEQVIAGAAHAAYKRIRGMDLEQVAEKAEERIQGSGS
jgi:hypothetical protein